MTLYCSVVKLHKVDSELATQAVDRFENRQADFRALFANALGRKFPQSLVNKLEPAQAVRNRVLHGKNVAEKGFPKGAGSHHRICRGIQPEVLRLGTISSYWPAQGI